MQRQVRLVAATLALATVAQAGAPPASVEGEGWVVRASTTGARLVVELRARGAFHLNDDYPIHFDVAPDPHVAYGTKRVENKDVQRQACKGGGHYCGATATLPFSTSGAGRAGGTLAFAVCDADRCVIEKVAVSAPAEPHEGGAHE